MARLLQICNTKNIFINWLLYFKLSEIYNKQKIALGKRWHISKLGSFWPQLQYNSEFQHIIGLNTMLSPYSLNTGLIISTSLNCQYPLEDSCKLPKLTSNANQAKGREPLLMVHHSLSNFYQMPTLPFSFAFITNTLYFHFPITLLNATDVALMQLIIAKLAK